MPVVLQMRLEVFDFQQFFVTALNVIFEILVIVYNPVMVQQLLGIGPFGGVLYEANFLEIQAVCGQPIGQWWMRVLNDPKKGWVLFQLKVWGVSCQQLNNRAP